MRIISRPLIRATYHKDIQQFVDLGCNRNGANVIVFSAHGARSRVQTGKRYRTRRELTAFDGDINLSAGIRRLNDKLNRSVLILDSRWVGRGLQSFQEASGALGVLGFAKKVDSVDSAVFILAVLFKLHENGALGPTDGVADHDLPSDSTAQDTVTEMISSSYSSLAKSLGVEISF